MFCKKKYKETMHIRNNNVPYIIVFCIYLQSVLPLVNHKLGRRRGGERLCQALASSYSYCVYQQYKLLEVLHFICRQSKQIMLLYAVEHSIFSPVIQECFPKQTEDALWKAIILTRIKGLNLLTAYLS